MLLSLEDNPEKVIEYFQGEAGSEASFEMQVILATACEELGDYESAYEIYQHLQSAHASHIYLEKQIQTLYKL